MTIVLQLPQNKLTVAWRADTRVEEDWAPLHHISTKAETLPGCSGGVKAYRDNGDEHDRYDSSLTYWFNSPEQRAAGLEELKEFIRQQFPQVRELPLQISTQERELAVYWGQEPQQPIGVLFDFRTKHAGPVAAPAAA